MKKIIIIGCPSSGKTTLANRLGSFFNIPVHHLDKIFWKDNWMPSHQEEFIKIQNEIMTNDTWIIDGDFIKSKSFNMRLNAADTIIFFHFSKLTIFYRNAKRYFQNFNKVRPDMGGNNKQKHPLNWGVIKFAWNYPNEQIYEKLKNISKDKKVIILRNKREENYFLKTLS